MAFISWASQAWGAPVVAIAVVIVLVIAYVASRK
jgi:hypothetical protein